MNAKAETPAPAAANGDPGSDGTILNKPAPSFFHGVTRAGFPPEVDVESQFAASKPEAMA